MRLRRFPFILWLVILCGVSLTAFAETVSLDLESSLVGRVANLVFQLSIILFAARISGRLFEKAGLPEVLGEIAAGVIIGPYVLGQLVLPGFPQGLFPLSETGFPVSIELYGIATIASIVLLFLVGLETDIDTFMAFSGVGSVIGIGGVVVSFLLGDLTIVWFSRIFLGHAYSFADPVALFFGVISTATSVGITARILSDKRKMNSPEGVTIISAAVIDDVLGIIILAIVVGVIKSGRLEWREVGAIAVRTVSIWLGFTVLGLVFSRQISRFLKRFRNRGVMAVMSLALAMLLAGVFEKSGLAMIIGAYIMGLSLSKTDLSFVIQEHLSMLYQFFVPVFFTVMGMLVDVKALTHPGILAFGMVFVVLATLGKLLGCSIPALFMDFNARGALRVGVGMVPRGEVALIIAGLGLSLGILSNEYFSVAIIMTFMTTLITPPALARLLDSSKPAMRRKIETRIEQREIVYSLPNAETAELIINRTVEDLEGEGFYVHVLRTHGDRLYQIRKGTTFMTMKYSGLTLTFVCQKRDVPFVHTLFYEVLAEIEALMKRLQGLTDRRAIGKRIFGEKDDAQDEKRKKNGQYAGAISPLAVSVSLRPGSKEEILEQLLELLSVSGQLDPVHKQSALDDLLERERTMSTGMQEGIALPHAKTPATDRLVSAAGLVRDGVDFDSLDGKPSRIFILTLAPKDAHEPYLEYMAEVSRMLMNHEHREKILGADNDQRLYETLTRQL